MPENLARYLAPDGTLGKVLIVFKDVAKRCDTRLFESSHYLIGEKVEEDGSKSQMRLGEIVLQMFRLPALPLVPADQLVTVSATASGLTRQVPLTLAVTAQ